MMVGVRLLRSAVAVRGKIVKVVHGRQVMMATVGKIVEPSCKIVQLWNRKGYHTAKLFANGISVERTDDAFSLFMNGQISCSKILRGMWTLNILQPTELLGFDNFCLSSFYTFVSSNKYNDPLFFKI